MSLNNIQLKPRMLADLYPDSLLETKAVSASPTELKSFLGSNQKQIAVVVNHPQLPFLPDEELSFLTTVLNACKLGIADIALFNYAKLDQTVALERVQAAGDKVILFGIDPLTLGLPINFPSFQLQSFDKRLYLCAPTLNEVEGDKALKTRLWGCLKSLFGI